MARRLLSVAVLAGSAVMLLHAQGTVTFVMTNGERAVGDSADRTEPNPIMPYGELNLYAGPEKNERSFAQEIVAVIDYTGEAKPGNDELAALPQEGQMIALRNGTRSPGRIAGLRDGVLRWTGTSGRTEEYPVSQISRVYLNVDAARSVYHYTPSAGVTPPAQTPVIGRGVSRGGAGRDIAVMANRDWTDTGIAVRSGEVLRFDVSGEIKFGMGDNQTATAGGNTSVLNPSFPVPSLPVGALIGRVGNGAPFPIGASADPLTVDRTGRLFLGINDDQHGDNSGQFVVTIIRGR
jgi:hypothetical protein